ncbi:MAG: AraC family transcriptional regulator [Clostridia bacterium]|nr:AraC family transcriptional regulator [Clostridia bacterium]
MPKFYQTIHRTLPEQALKKVNMQKTKDLLLVKTNEFIEFPEHMNEDFQINVVPPSPPPLTLNRKDYCYTKKSIAITPPGVLVACKYRLPSEEYYLITVSKDRFKEVFSDISPSAYIQKPLNFPYSRQLFRLVQGLYEELDKKYAGYELMIQSKLTEFLIQLFRESRVNESGASVGRNPSYIDRALEYIHAYYNADICLDDICRELELSRYHFIRIFKAHTGKTPHAYLLDVRLDNALQLLKKGDHSLEEVAYLCGFVNQIHFSQCFKKKYGITPTRFKSMP